MTQGESNGLRKMLQSSVIELHSSTDYREAIAVERAADPMDRMLGATNRELAVMTLEMQAFKRQQANAALRRIDEGTYGICQDCEEKIHPKRLAAMPTAALCLACQEANDILHPRYGRAMAA